MLFKLIRSTNLIISFLISSMKSMLIDDENEKKRFFAENTSHYSKKMLKILNIHVQYNLLNLITKCEHSNGMFICNHLSWLDVLILAAWHPMLFITSTEVGESFFLGKMALAGGSFFVNRKNKKNIFVELNKISQALNEGHWLTLFPEATSSNGEQVLDFKGSFIEACRLTDKKIYPLCLNYETIDDQDVNRENRDRIFWYGDMAFIPSFFNILKCKKIVVRLSVFDKQDPHSYGDRKGLTGYLQNLLMKEYKRIS